MKTGSLLNIEQIGPFNTYKQIKKMNATSSTSHVVCNNKNWSLLNFFAENANDAAGKKPDVTAMNKATMI